MIKGDISRPAEVNKEWHPDYKPENMRGGLTNGWIYRTSKRQKGNLLTSVSENKVLD